MIKKINSFFSSRSSILVKFTGKSKWYIHPKHLVHNPFHHWYLKYISITDKILDVGCGNGIHTISCAKKCKEAIGFDYDPMAINLAKELAYQSNTSNVTFFTSSAEEKWSFPDEYFDKVILLDVLAHLKNRDFALAEARRVLKKSGLLLLTVPNSQTSWKKLQKRLGLFYFSDPDHKIEYTCEEIILKLEKSGFTILDIQPIVYDTPWYGLIDFIGGISLRLYANLLNWKIKKTKNNPRETIGFRIVCQKN